MTRRRRADEYDDVKLDMTPMIDVVFQLIIFFMLVNDMTQQDLAELKLPVAQEAVKDELTQGRLTLNIHTDGVVEIKRVPMGTLDDPVTQQVVRELLAREVLLGERDPETGASERPILIRADRETEFKHIQKLMQICGEQGIMIYQMHLAAAQPQGES